MKTLTERDIDWIERKRMEVHRLGKLFKGKPWKSWDVPRAIDIINKLIRMKVTDYWTEKKK